MLGLIFYSVMLQAVAAGVIIRKMALTYVKSKDNLILTNRP